jgi:hypothetical protein
VGNVIFPVTDAELSVLPWLPTSILTATIWHWKIAVKIYGKCSHKHGKSSQNPYIIPATHDVQFD